MAWVGGFLGIPSVSFREPVRRRRVVVSRHKPGGLDGLHQKKGWTGLNDEDLRKGRIDDVSADTLRRHLNRAMLENRGDSVSAVFQFAGNHDGSMYQAAFKYEDVHAIMRECMRKKMWGAGLNALDFLEKNYAPLRMSTYAVAAGGLAKSNRVTELRDLVMKLLQKKDKSLPMPDPDERLCALAANIAVENNRIQIATNIASEMEAAGIPLGPLTYSILIKGYGRKRRMNDVKRQLLKMKNKGVRGDLVLYNTAIDAFVRGGMLNLAEKVLNGMRQKGVEPDEVSFNTLMKGLIKSKRLREAFRLRKQMEDEGYKVDDVTRNSLLMGCVNSERYDDALQLLDEVVAKECSEKDAQIAYTSIIAGLAKSGDLTRALSYISKMKQNMVRPNAVTYTSIISGALATGDVNRAWSTLRIMDRDGIVADKATYNALINGLCKCSMPGGLESAQKVLKTMRDRGVYVDTNTYNTLINGYVDQRRMRDAEHVLVLMKRAGVELDVVTYTTLLKGYGKERTIGEVRRIFREMQSNNIEPDVYSLNTFLASCVKSGYVALAYRFFKEMRKESQSPDVYTYVTIMSGLAKDSRNFDAWNLYGEMKSSGISPNAPAIEVLMRVITSSSLDTFGVKEAKILLQDAKNIGMSSKKISEYKAIVENLDYMTSETWKQRSFKNADYDADAEDDDSASNNIFRSHNWNEIDSSFKLI